MSLTDIRTIIAAYMGPSVLLDQLGAKWGLSNPLLGPSITDKDAIRFAKEDFRRDTLKVAEILLTAEERKEAELESETFV
jgi:hypothetical protein